MKKTLTIIVIVLLVATVIQAQGVGVSLTESYRWHGFKLYGDSFVHPNVSAAFGDVDIRAVGHADDAEMDDLEYWDTSVGYTLPGDGLIFRGGYNYLVLPNSMDVQEISGTVSLPGIVSPRYTVIHVVPDNSNKGQIHVLGMDVLLGDFSDSDAISGILSADVVYNDGVNPFSEVVFRDWSHATAGLTVNVPVGNVIFQPAVYYQHTFEASVESDKNEVWYGVGVQYRY